MSSNGQALAERYLKFGIFLAPFHPMEESPLLCMERDMQLLQHIDMLGYDEAVSYTHLTLPTIYSV